MPPLIDRLLARLKDYCEAGRVRQTGAAEAIGVSRQRINDWLSGRVQPTGEQALALLEFLERAESTDHMKTEVYRAYCTAGTPATRTEESPVKFVTVQFSEDRLRNMSIAEAKRNAITYGKMLLEKEILNDPQFQKDSRWEARKEVVDLSDYATPNLQGKGSKVWIN
jgi:transcriptional regulator with XRE-family HTH domain